MEGPATQENSPAEVSAWTGRAVLILFAAIVMIQLGSGLARSVLSSGNAPGFALIRTAVSSALLWAFVRPALRGLTRQWQDIGDFIAGSTILQITLAVSALIALAYAMEFYALKQIEPRVFGALLSTEPAIAAVIGMLLLREFLSLNSWFAIGLVTAAALGVALTARRLR